ncbi:YoaK family protein [Rhizobium sp. FKY42]|uniref:YoaK family protein n=1 Tax=Rhizobium sp. FKY42 TaxID=2562310 RepID=UPI0010C13561|nr:YoaK family protein [Rhizobium sp. FKY42]
MTVARRKRLIRAQRAWTGIALVAAISFLAGMTDAIGLRLSGDFVSFMTGNTTRAAIFIVDGNWGHGLVLLGAIALFVMGNALGIVMASIVRRRIFGVLAAVALLLSLASILDQPQFGVLRFYLVVLAMGVVNAAVEQIEGLPIGLTYVTGALSRLGRGIGRFIMGNRRLDWSIQIVPWSGMVTGALCGALIGGAFARESLFLAAVFAMTIAISSLFIRKTLHHRYNHRSASTSRR